MNVPTLRAMSEIELVEYIEKQETIVSLLRRKLAAEKYDLLIAQDEYLKRTQEKSREQL